MDNKNIKYINKDFTDFRNALIDYAKTYFPDAYNDFSPNSPGSIFIDMASYVGDVLSFYQDNQIQENFIQYAKEKENIFSLAYMLGYRPKITNAAIVDLDVYQQVPSKIVSGTYYPDFDYCSIIKEGSQIQSSIDNNLTFYIPDKIDFSISSSLNPTEITIYSTSGNVPQYYLLKKTIKAISGELKTKEFSFGSYQKYASINLTENNIISIESIIDSDGNKWYEVPYLAQEMVYDSVYNTNGSPYTLKLLKTNRRFVTRFTSNDNLQIEFGSGNNSQIDETIVPNFTNIGLGLINDINRIDKAYDPSNFLFTNTYGISPSNTTLTVNYLVGGGVRANAPSNTINKISKIIVDFNKNNLTDNIRTYVINSISFNNPNAAVGGADGDTLEEIRMKSISSFSSQQRAVTKDDYIVRTLSLPQKYGTVSKAYISQTYQPDIDNIIDNNPLSLNLYVLSLDSNNNLSQASDVIKNNIKTYLSQYKLLTDNIVINNAYIINISIKFDIIVLPNFNNNQVLIECINNLKNYFDINKWQINQPIIMSEIYSILGQTKGVQNVSSVTIENKVGEELGYSKYAYDIKSATKNNVIYPSMDPSIFEIKYPNSDIIGRVITI